MTTLRDVLADVGDTCVRRRDPKVVSNQDSVTTGVVIRNGHSYAIERFEDMNFSERLLQGLHASSLTKPTAVQKRISIPLSTGYDVIVNSCPGMGRNVTLSVAILQTIDPSSLSCQALVITSSAEAAEHLQLAIADLGRFMNVKCLACSGNTRLKDDISALKERVHVIVGTLERIYDLLNRNALRIEKIKIFGISDAKEMIMGKFKNQIYDIIKNLKSHTQLLFFSLTVEEEILDEFRKIIRYPTFLIESDEVQILENAKYFQVPVQSLDSKPQILSDLFKSLPVTRTVIFCQSEEEVHEVMNTVQNKKCCVMSVLKTELSQEEKEEIINNFSTPDVNTLVATDVLKLKDVHNVSLVINYGFPNTTEHFINRTLRGYRSTHKIVVIIFFTESDKKVLQLVEKTCKTEIEMEKLPEDCKRLYSFFGTEDEHDFRTEENSHIKQSSDCCNPCIINTFNGVLREELLHGLQENGITEPTDLQMKAIIPCLNGYDVIIHANKTSSKTTALAIAILQSIDTKLKHCQVLVLAGTREMAQNIYEVLVTLGRNIKVECQVFFGGKQVRGDFALLKKCIHVIVGTAGRIMDLVHRKAIRTNYIKMFVLEEVSLLFSKQQRNQTREIFNALNSDVQLTLSSTITPNIATNEIRKFLKEPLCVVLRKDEKSYETIKQLYLPFTKEKLSFEDISNLYVRLTISQSVIFCNKKPKNKVGKISEHIKQFTESDFYEKLDSEERKIIMTEFSSVCDYTLFSTTLLNGKNKGQVAVFINYDMLTKRENHLLYGNRRRSFFHDGVVANISPESVMSVIQKLKDFFE